MARYITTITNKGAQVLTQFIAAGMELNLFQAAVGSGVTQADPAAVTALVSPLDVEAMIGPKQWVAGEPGHMLVPVEITNRGLTENAPIRELGIWAYDMAGTAFLFTYSRLDGADSDNILPPPQDPDTPDTSHIHNLAIVITNQEYGSITVEIAPGFGVTWAQMLAYAAPLTHTHAATAITESTGESVEEAQRRQDNTLLALQAQLNTFSWTFAPAELGQWVGYNGSGLPGGILDPSTGKLYY